MKNEKLKRIMSHPPVVLLKLFIAIVFLYGFLDLVREIPQSELFINGVYAFILIGIAITFAVLAVLRKINFKLVLIFILIFGVALRLIYANSVQLSNDGYYKRQHDVLRAYDNGHFAYAFYIFRTGKLPNSNYSQYYQPPLNAILQAIWMRITSLFIPRNNTISSDYAALFTNTDSISGNTALIEYINKLYGTTKILGCYYSAVTLYVISLILKDLNVKKPLNVIILGFIAIQPVMVMMAGTFNNDNLSYMFFFLAILFAIKWYNKPTYLISVLLALSIGLGMVTKLSIGLVAFVIGPMMLVKIVKELKEKKFSILFKTLTFAVIVFPLGLSYAIRNYIKFDQEITYILDFGRDSWLHENIKDRTFFERFFSLPLSQMINEDYGIYHDYKEYNIWVDLFKTSIFEEFSYDNHATAFAVMMYVCNLFIFLLTIPAMVYCIILLIKKKINGKEGFLVMLSIAIALLALISYISLNIKMPYSCTSNFRYVTYLAFSSITLLSYANKHIKVKGINIAYYSIIGTFALAVPMFLLSI